MRHRNRVFVSYSRKDEVWVERLRIHLAPLEQDRVVDLWDDSKISPGSKWKTEIENAVNSARIAILVISPDFMASRFIAENELPPLLAAAESDGVSILPIIIKPSRFTETPLLSQFQTINDPKLPLIDLKEGDQEREWVKLVNTIEKILKNKINYRVKDEAKAAEENLFDYSGHLEEGDREGDTYEEARGYDIVKLRFPRQDVRVVRNYTDRTNRISYEFVTVKIAKNIIMGHLFVKKNISIGNTIEHFFDNLSIRLSSLSICSPRIISSSTGKAVDRLGSIRDRVESVSSKYPVKHTEYYYVDKYVWEYCLAEHPGIIGVKMDKEKYFVDQELYWEGNNGPESKPSLDYIEDLIQSSDHKRPVSIIVGTAGVGKTTFCEQAVRLINSTSNKRALLISSADLREAIAGTEVSSITDLYRFYTRITEVDSASVLESNNLEINISCGNIVLIIDGLDEIESILKEKFDIERFLNSAVKLNESYRSCSIIVTTRDYFSERYLGKHSSSVLSLKGFTAELVDEYLEKRLPVTDRSLAKRYLREFDITEQDRHIPLYLSLVCDLVERSEYKGGGAFVQASDSVYFHPEFPFDRLVFELIQREIGKQLINISCDEYFELLAEIAVVHRGHIPQKRLDEYIEVMIMPERASGDGNTKYGQFYSSPLLNYTVNRREYSLKYDYCETWILSRYFIHNYVNRRFEQYMVDMLVDMHDGTSPLFVELMNVKKKKPNVENFEYTRGILTKLQENVSGEMSSVYKVTSRNSKPISGLLYFALGGHERNRADYTDKLVSIYGGVTICNLCIYGVFYPVDFSDLNIHYSWFERYGNFEKCKFPSGRIVFFDSIFKGIDARLGTGLTAGIFDESCSLNKELEDLINEGVDSAGNVYRQIQNDMYRILKVGFRAGGFRWKSESIYNMVTIRGVVPLSKYLRFLVKEGVLDKVPDRDDKASQGYVVSKDFRSSAKHLIANNTVKNDLEKVIFRIMEEFYGILL